MSERNELDAGAVRERMFHAAWGAYQKADNGYKPPEQLIEIAIEAAILASISFAAPPERHDAPGVSVEDVSELFSAVVDDEGWQLCQDNPELIARIRAALTGSPDAAEGSADE